MVRFQRLTGARPGEVCQLRPVDVDRSGDVWEYRPESHKTEHHGRERIIYIGPQAQAGAAALSAAGRPGPLLLRRPKASRIATRNNGPAASTRVQPSQRNRRKARPKRVAQNDLHQGHLSAGDCHGRSRRPTRCGRRRPPTWASTPVLLPHWHANQLRHSKATEIRRQFGLEAAQVILGHAKADVTQVYAERDTTLAVEVMRKLG